MEEKVRIQNSKQLELAAVIHRPRSEPPYPAAIVAHGYLGCKDERHIIRFSEALAEAGILAIRFDTCGINESDGSPSQDFRVSQNISDAEVIREYLSALTDVDTGRIGICGHSLGASVAIICAARDSEWAACCAVQPPTKMTRQGGTRELEFWEKEGELEQGLGAPMRGSVMMPVEFARDADQWDASQYAGRVRCSLMIMYGTADEAVAPENVLSIYEASPAEKATLVKLQDIDHDFQFMPEALELVTQKLVDFFTAELR